MTISNNDNPQQFTGTGADTPLGTVFLFFTATDIIVTQRITATGVALLLTDGVHYAVTGGSDTGAVGVVTPLDGATDFTTAMTWTIERAIPLTQAHDYLSNDTFPAESHETGLDRLTMQSQDKQAIVDRSIRFPETDLLAVVSELPDSVTRAGKVLSFDSSGNVALATPTTVGFGKVLLDSEDAANQGEVVMTATNWPALYDRIELELINILSASGSLLELKPIDSGTPSSTNLSTQIYQFVGATATTPTGTDWQLNQAAGGTADDVISGSATFTYNGGFLNGEGAWTYRNATNHCSAFVSYQRHTTVGTQWDGIEVSFTTGNITSGTVRLWGIPKV